MNDWSYSVDLGYFRKEDMTQTTYKYCHFFIREEWNKNIQKKNTHDLWWDGDLWNEQLL